MARPFPLTRMKQTNDKEMDLLLSRLARRSERGAPGEFKSGAGDNGGDNTTPSMMGAEHPDADELNAYAENALLPATRARYTAHLADCETCRKLVTNLALAANVAGSLEKSAGTSTQAVSKDKSWWQSLGSIFALPVVHYGVPALALLALISVVFIFTKQRQESGLVAQNKETAPVSAVRPVAEENHAQGSSTETTANAPTVETTPSESLSNTGGSNSNLDQLSARKQEKVEPTPAKENAEAKEVAPPARADADLARNSPPVAAGPPAPLRNPSDAPAQPKPTSQPETNKDNLAKSGEAAAEPAPPQKDDSFEDRKAASGNAARASERQQQQSRNNMDRGRDMTIDGTEESPYLSKDKQGRMSPPAPAAASVARRREGARAKTESTASRENESADESTSEKRSVAGRTFRRQGNAWVDTAYNSSRATVNISRGSEQYRALLADEPSLRTIAEQLGGEVVVVWKGRAYRIH